MSKDKLRHEGTSSMKASGEMAVCINEYMLGEWEGS